MELFAKKSLGQHFLTSQAALAQIVEAAALAPGERVLEIGPGTGILTSALMKTGAHVIAVEKDDRAIALLAQKFPTLELHHADILEADKSALGLTNGEYALVANIPYYITGAILESFLEYAPRPNRMVLLVQKEVADRIVARDGKESILSVSVKAFGTPRMVAKVPRGAFNPPPTVDSAILTIEHISGAEFARLNIDVKKFFAIVKAGFAHKRKLLRRNLEEVCSPEKISAAWQTLSLDEKIRAEDMTVEQWVSLAQAISK